MDAPIKYEPGLAVAQDARGDLDAIYAKIAKRIIPFLAVLFTMAYVDRNNVGFAELSMRADLKFSHTVYGFGAGIVYLGYALFEIPSNLLLARIGARKTFARIAVLWGVVSIATMFVRTPTQFYVLRFLLGAFEAGLFPGVILYLTYWFPARRGAQMLALFVTSIPISYILSGPVSGWIMDSMGGRAGLASWQWLFLTEGIPSIILGILALLMMVDKPAEAGWLTEGEKRLVLSDLEADRQAAGPREHGFGQALRLPQLWLLAFIRFCAMGASLTIGLKIPTIIHGFGVKSDFTVGWLYSFTYIAVLSGVLLVGHHSDRTGDRRYHAAFAYLASGLGIIGIGVFAAWPVLAFACMVLAAAGGLMADGPFWQIPRILLAGQAAAGGIALINSISCLSGWVGNSVIGWLTDVTGKMTIGFYFVGTSVILGTVLLLLSTNFCTRRPTISRV
jgi:MFS family permease